MVLTDADKQYFRYFENVTDENEAAQELKSRSKVIRPGDFIFWQSSNDIHNEEISITYVRDRFAAETNNPLKAASTYVTIKADLENLAKVQKTDETLLQSLENFIEPRLKHHITFDNDRTLTIYHTYHDLEICPKIPDTNIIDFKKKYPLCSRYPSSATKVI